MTKKQLAYKNATLNYIDEELSKPNNIFIIDPETNKGTDLLTQIRKGKLGIFLSYAVDNESRAKRDSLEKEVIYINRAPIWE